MGDAYKYVGVDSAWIGWDEPMETYVSPTFRRTAYDDERDARMAVKKAANEAACAALIAGRGQYVQVGNVLFPIIIRVRPDLSIEGIGMVPDIQMFEQNGVRYHRSGMIAIGEKTGRRGPEPVWEQVYRLADAPMDSPWYRQDDFSLFK